MVVPMNGLCRSLLWTGLAAVATMAAPAQSTYPVHSLDFDIWCTEEQHIPYERCERRLPEDVAKFEAYREIVERYEIPYLQEKDLSLHFDKALLHNDPVDKRPNSHVQQPPNPTDGY